MDLDQIPIAAEQLARGAHLGQFRRDGVTPYIRHVEDTVARLLRDDAGPRTIAVAWLHDVLEDTDVTPEQLRELVGSEIVVETVETLTKRSKERYTDYLARVLQNPFARAVKIADILANLADDPTEKQIRKYALALLFLVGD